MKTATNSRHFQIIWIYACVCVWSDCQQMWNTLTLQQQQKSWMYFVRPSWNKSWISSIQCERHKTNWSKAQVSNATTLIVVYTIGRLQQSLNKQVSLNVCTGVHARCSKSKRMSTFIVSELMLSLCFAFCDHKFHFVILNVPIMHGVGKSMRLFFSFLFFKRKSDN